MKKVFISLIILFQAICLAGVNVMAPLIINNEGEWQAFENRLHQLKQSGVTSISTDVWWGAVEREKGQFDWAYYDRMSTLIQNAGLNWVPIMSFHQCGGNVGDNCNIPLPNWVWNEANGKEIPSFFGGDSFHVSHSDQIKYLSELGRTNSEFPSVWSTPVMADLYVNFVREFSNHFQSKFSIIEEINISLGPAGELRYPAYNSHDQFFPSSPAMFPNRGSFQGHSELAKKSYRDFLRQKYSNNIQNLNSSWNSGYASFDHIDVPDHETLNHFAQYSTHYQKYGKDLYDWYHQSLMSHGEIILTKVDQMKAQSAMASIPLGVKVPGIHWNMGVDFGLGNGFQFSHRLTEMNSGLISSGDDLISDPESGAGYRNLISKIKKIDNQTTSPFILHFTCLEMGNNENSQMGAMSMAKSLVHWFGDEAARQGVAVKGENALEGSLYNPNSWTNIFDAIEYANYEGLTILRMGPLTDNPMVKEKIKETASKFQQDDNCFDAVNSFMNH